ncbi:MAG: GGDEF domain-containing protein [Pseudomonadota bacterium]
MPGLFPKNDPKQTLILKRFFLAFGSYMIAVGFGSFSVVTGNSLISTDLMMVIFAGVCLSNLYFYWVIRSGYNKQYDDPSLTIPQQMVALAWMLCLMFADAQHRGLFLSVYTMIIMFGLFRLRTHQMATLAAVAVSGYALVVALDAVFFPHRFDVATELIRGGVLLSLVAWATVFAGHVSQLRDKLRRRNRDLSVALDEIGKLASHDDLTNAFNRRYIMDALKQEVARAQRTGSTFSVCLLDLDHFKTINDRYGHLAGDRVLMAFSERIKGTLRGMDLVDHGVTDRFFGRYGGEEFIVVLPDTPLAGAIRCAERIRRVTEESSFDEVFRVTLSAGVSQYEMDESIEDMLRRADVALYEAKNKGRNRVEIDQSQLGRIEQSDYQNTAVNIVVGSFGARKKTE